MEQNLPILAKKFWKLVQVVYVMLRKGISKPKLMANLTSILKRGKIAGKALISHHGGATSAATAAQISYPTPVDEYEFSCRNSPAYPNFQLPFHLGKRRRAAARALQPEISEEDIFAAVVEIVSSPALPGFGRTPAVRQLRVTDSPFPVVESEEDRRLVNDAAEEFITRFYRDLRLQN